MPPTNNHAEQALRLPVIFRKISFGSRSLHGAQAAAANLSLLTTAYRQQRNPLDLLHTIVRIPFPLILIGQTVADTAAPARVAEEDTAIRQFPNITEGRIRRAMS